MLNIRSWENMDEILEEFEASAADFQMALLLSECLICQQNDPVLRERYSAGVWERAREMLEAFLTQYREELCVSTQAARNFLRKEKRQGA